MSICILLSCDKAPVQNDITKAYGLPDKTSTYNKLATLEPNNLSKDELYSRILTLWGTPYVELNLPTSFGSTHIVVSGPADGEALILLHGMNTDSTMWYPNVKALSEKYRVYAIDDILGPGKSTPKHDDTSIDTLTSWYFEVFDALKIDKLTLVGASQGGWIATHLAIANPSRLNHLILLSPAQTLTWLEPSMDIFTNLLFALNPEREDLRGVLATFSSNVDGINQLYIDQFFRTMKTAPTSPLLTQMHPFEDPQLATLTMPVLVLIGDQDLLNDQASIDRARQTLPCVQAEILENSGHFISVDQAQLVNAKIIEFVGGKSPNKRCQKPVK